MSDNSNDVLEVLRKIHGLLELLAEDKIAERDTIQRQELKALVGASVPMQRSVLLMDGTRTQKEIISKTSAHQGNLSTLVGRLRTAKLLVADEKNPKLAISIPPSFFKNND